MKKKTFMHKMNTFNRMALDNKVVVLMDWFSRLALHFIDHTLKIQEETSSSSKVSGVFVCGGFKSFVEFEKIN